MIFFPNAKINIGLKITRKRPDGYHDIETLFYPVGLCDALEFVVHDNNKGMDSLIATGIGTGSPASENLVLKIIARLRQKFFFPFLKIHLHKAIPVGSGLGGGSSDAVYILKAVIRYFQLPADDKILRSIALETGSDCPFFIDNIPSLASGRGEILTHVQPFLSGYYLVLLNPGLTISTREAYGNCKPEIPTASLAQLIGHPVDEWKELIKNDFEEYVFNIHPSIGELKQQLYKHNAFFSLMSGSGSSVYGLFREEPELPEKIKNLIIWEGTL